MASYNLWVKCDFPPVQGVIKVAGTTKLGDVKKEGISSLPGLSAFDLTRYSFYGINYKSDVIALDKLSDDEALCETGLKDRGYIFIRAPADIKPPIKGAAAKKKKGDEKAEQKDKFAGITPANVLSKMQTAKGSKKNLFLEYIDIFFKKILPTGKIQQLPEAVLLSLVKRDTLNVKEIDLFDVCVLWGKEECKRRELADSTSNLKTVLEPILPHIRFPVMTTEEVAVGVSASGLLSPEQILSLFTYLGQAAEGGKPKLPSELKFTATPRKGRLPPPWFRFEDAMKHAQLMLMQDGLQLTSTTTSYYQPAFGNIELKEGIHEWEFVLQQLYSGSYAVCIGVVPGTWTDYTRAQMIGYPSHIPGWAYAAAYGQKFHNSQESYGRTCAEGDVVRVRLDLEKKTLEFFVNGTSQGIAYKDVTAPVRPAVSLYGNTSIVLRFPK